MSKLTSSKIRSTVRSALRADTLFLKRLAFEEKVRERQRAIRLREITKQAVKNLADNAAPEVKPLAAQARRADSKARAHIVHAQIAEHTAMAEQASAEADLIVPASLDAVRINDLSSQFRARDLMNAQMRERMEVINAKINWRNRDDTPAYFNTCFQKNKFPVDEELSIFAHMSNPADDLTLGLEAEVDAILECGLFSRVKAGRFEYSRRCQNIDHCRLCNYLDVKLGVKELVHAYDERAFIKGGFWFAFTIAPRSAPEFARAVGSTIRSADWDYGNPASVVFQESRKPPVFRYDNSEDLGADWEIQSKIRQFLGTVQFVLKKLYRNHWVTGLRARVENAIAFLPYRDHWHDHGVFCSKIERDEQDAQRMADLVKADIDALLCQNKLGIWADVMVAIIPTADDLRRWIKYANKTSDLVSPIHCVYKRHPELRRSDAAHKQLMSELRQYLNRHHTLFKTARLFIDDERGTHTYSLRKNFVCGNQKFGEGSILTESERHKNWRKQHARLTAARRAEKNL